MSKKYTYVYNIPDFKDANGKWVRSYYPTQYENHTTRSGKLWISINERCKLGGSFQKKRPTYIGCTNCFSDFQEFAEWCQHQYGYINKEENGNYWAIDKDLIEYGNKIYSPEKCLFVPTRINTLLIASNASMYEYPLGVTWDKQRKKFRANCSNGSGKSQYLGLFTDPQEAHHAWQKAKIQVMEDILINDKELMDHTKLVTVIQQNIQRLKDDVNEKRESK